MVDRTLALDMPFLLLPFRPASDPSAARTFIRNYFSPDKGAQLVGARLEQELMLTGPMVSQDQGVTNQSLIHSRFSAVS